MPACVDTDPKTDAPVVSNAIPDAPCCGLHGRCRAVAGPASGRYPGHRADPACPALQARWRWPVSHRDRAAWLRRIGRAVRAGAAALPRLGGTTVEDRPCGAAAGQLRIARARPAMPRQGAPCGRPPRAGGRRQCIAAVAVAAALGRARPDQPGRMGERRQRSVVGGASATGVAQRRTGFPFGHRVLSGLPDLVRPRLEHAGADAAADRRAGRRQFAVRPAARWSRAPAAAARWRRSWSIPAQPHDFDRANLPLRSIAGADAALPERGHIGTDADARRDAQRRVTGWLAR